MILVNEWQEVVTAIERDFREGNMTDLETQLRLRTMFDAETADLMWARLYNARKYDQWD